MRTGLRIRRSSGPVSDKITRIDRLPANVPLGTAAWFRFRDGVRPTCKSGDLFLGRLASGESVGFNDNRHVLITAGTRSGKGASIIIPNACLWPGSMVVIDPKGENAFVTARRRAGGSKFCKGKKQKVRILDPFNTVLTPFDTFQDLKAQFNPLVLVLLNHRDAVDLAAQIAASLVIKESSNDPFWEESARALLQALILHVVSSKTYADHERNLVTVWRLLRRGDETNLSELLRMNGVDSGSYAGLFEAMAKNTAYDGVVAGAGMRFGAMASESPRSFQGMVQVACTNTDFMNSPQIRHSLARSDFALSDLKTDPKGVSLYLCLPQRYMESHNRWLRMIVTLMLFEMERVAQQPRCGHPVLTILDEFASLKRMTVIENAVAQIAGYGVKLVMAVQSLPQLKEQYKDNWETLVANCGAKLFFCNDDQFTREYVAKLIGECEVVRATKTQSKTKGTSSSASQGETLGTSQSFGSSHTNGMNFGGQNTTFSSSSTTNRNNGYSQSSTFTSTSGSNRSQSQGTNESVHKRYLINPDEVGRFFGDTSKPRAIALISGLQPLCLDRAVYFRDDAFAGWYDHHRDHPLPRTLKQVAADNKATERAREKAARLKRQKEEEKRLARQRAELAKRRAENEAHDRDMRERRERIREEEEKQAARIKVSVEAGTMLISLMFINWLLSG